MNALVAVMASDTAGNILRATVIITIVLLLLGFVAYFKFRDRDSL